LLPFVNISRTSASVGIDVAIVPASNNGLLQQETLNEEEE
jgi:hypothetical protein